MIFVNFKTYERGTGAAAVTLARVLMAVSESTGVKVIPVVQTPDMKEVTSAVSLPVWAQHVDSIEFGAHTGSILPSAVAEDGAQGTFLNHSEIPFKKFADLKKAHLNAIETGLKTLIFAGDLGELKNIVKLAPTYVSYEPPELVGSKTTSVAQAKPEIISEAVKIANKYEIPLIVGAGIKSAEDVRVSLRLGASGFAVASSVVDSEDSKGEILKLIEGYGE
jgi:triosephosphate isomerase